MPTPLTRSLSISVRYHGQQMPDCIKRDDERKSIKL